MLPLLIVAFFCRCVLELHAIATKKEHGDGRFAVAMTAQENKRFLTGIQTKPGEYYSMLGRVNAESSECSRAADRESIHEGIRRSVGFARLSRMVLGVMEGWMEEQLQLQVAACMTAGEDLEAIGWSSVLASFFSCQGRHDEALVLFESGLNYLLQNPLLCSQPEHESGIGETRLWLCG
jgi:hypothetical protein